MSEPLNTPAAIDLEAIAKGVAFMLQPKGWSYAPRDVGDSDKYHDIIHKDGARIGVRTVWQRKDRVKFDGLWPYDEKRRTYTPTNDGDGECRRLYAEFPSEITVSVTKSLKQMAADIDRRMAMFLVMHKMLVARIAERKAQRLAKEQQGVAIAHALGDTFDPERPDASLDGRFGDMRLSVKSFSDNYINCEISSLPPAALDQLIDCIVQINAQFGEKEPDDAKPKKRRSAKA